MRTRLQDTWIEALTTAGSTELSRGHPTTLSSPWQADQTAFDTTGSVPSVFVVRFLFRPDCICSLLFMKQSLTVFTVKLFLPSMIDSRHWETLRTISVVCGLRFTAGSLAPVSVSGSDFHFLSLPMRICCCPAKFNLQPSSFISWCPFPYPFPSHFPGHSPSS